MSTIFDDTHFERLLGFELLSAGETGATGQVEVSPAILQPGKVVHGGVYAALALSLAIHATAHRVGPDVARPLSNGTTFLRPMGEGRMFLDAECLHAGRSTTVWSVRISDARDRLCAASIVTLGHDDRVMAERPASSSRLDDGSR